VNEDGYKQGFALYDELPLLEKFKMIGQKLGYCPKRAYLCEGAVLNKRPIQYSLIVESAVATVISVTRYDMTHRFPFEVLSRVRLNMNQFDEWVVSRAEKLMQSDFQIKKEDEHKVLMQKKSQNSYPVANRAARFKMMSIDLMNSEFNSQEYFAFKQKNFGAKFRDDTDPNFVRSKKEKIQPRLEHRAPLRGFLTQSDIEELEETKNFLYGQWNIDKMHSEMKRTMLQDNKEYSAKDPQQVERAVKRFRAYFKTIKEVDESVDRMPATFYGKFPNPISPNRKHKI